MTIRRITITILVVLGLAVGAGPAMAFPSDLTPHGSEVSAGSPSVEGQSTGSPTLVHVSAPSGLVWGDVGIGAAGGIALAVIGVGGALVVSGRRARHASDRIRLAG